ncbi:imv surface protein [Skunkpox virus]|uniref:14 kDa protein n=1 Tax=Skunkpox virus TaxID=160796 RepID=Q6EL84_9POXV|nr:imv surface protein [Skunkpox virus]AAQ72922.1 14 kDa protein [Skunkpox virus]AOP31625.1 imv surface protein [Skunkpox virus]
MDGTLFPGDDDMAIPATEFFVTRAAKKPEEPVKRKVVKNKNKHKVVKADGEDDPDEDDEDDDDEEDDDAEETIKHRLTNLEKKITNVTTKFAQIEKCCKRNDEVLFRLENHAETLRAAMLTLAKKIDVQTGRQRYE